MRIFNIIDERKDVPNDKSLGENKKKLIYRLKQQLSSANINLLIGSGCSSPAIRVLGNIEEQIKEEKDPKKRKELIKNFKGIILFPHKNLQSEDVKPNIDNYKNFLSLLNKILSERDNTMLSRKTNIFTTNYDLFIEEACKDIPIILNDGFDRRKPLLKNNYKYSLDVFFNRLYTKGNIYNYEHELPIINLIKIHGSLSWKESLEDRDDIIFNTDLNEEFLGVMPTEEKYSETVMTKSFYEMLRFYSNELNKENTILISTGFSFNDSHIFSITKRQLLANPTLILIIFCYDKKDIEFYKNKFINLSNVWVVYDQEKNIDLNRITEILNKCLDENNG